jgi:hypothetical protein
MFEKMADNVTRNILILPFQSGFQPDQRAMAALVKGSDYICLNFELNQPTIFVLFDFSKVVDSICRGFHASPAAFVLSYIFGRHKKAPLVTGVSQRSLILPLCFFFN